MPARHREPEQGLQGAVHVTGGEQIGPARHQRHAVRRIVETPVVPGTSASLTIKGEFLPLEGTAESRALFETYRAAAQGFGIATIAEFTGGCADSGFSAALGVPTLCGVGPVGGLAHSPEEYLEVETLVPRALAMARSIHRFETAGI